MSDEFLKIATAEINDEILEIQNILNSCHDSLDVSANAAKIQKSTHKIKGLAPMMGKDDLGNLSSLLDSVLKKIIDGAIVDDLFDSMKDSVNEMKNSMIYSDYNLDVIKQRILRISSNLS